MSIVAGWWGISGRWSAFSHLVHLAETPHHTLRSCHSTCHGLHPSCVHSTGPHSRVATPHNPEATRLRAIESCDEILEGIRQIKYTLQEYAKLCSTINSQTNVIDSLVGHLGFDPSTSYNDLSLGEEPGCSGMSSFSSCSISLLFRPFHHLSRYPHHQYF
jgi:hypothetical protein